MKSGLFGWTECEAQGEWFEKKQCPVLARPTDANGWNSRRVRCFIFRVGQKHIYTRCVYTGCFGQGNHKIYGHVRCIYTVLANPIHIQVMQAGKGCVYIV